MKLQPNYSWQKYEGEEEDQKNQFQYQLQNQHIQVANTVNTTIDDMSYWTRERATSETWIDERQIYTKTLTGTIVGTAATPYPIGATIRTLVSLTGTAQDTVPMTAIGLTLPFINAAGDDIGLSTDLTNVIVDAFNAMWAGYTFYVTIKYTK